MPRFMLADGVVRLTLHIQTQHGAEFDLAAVKTYFGEVKLV